MKKTIILNFTITQIQQILQDGNYVSEEETLDKVSFSEEAGVTFYFSDKRFDIKNKDEVEKLLATKLIDFDTTVRFLNVLKAGNVETLGDLVKHSFLELRAFRNMGKKTLLEIQELVKSKGLELKNQ